VKKQRTGSEDEPKRKNTLVTFEKNQVKPDSKAAASKAKFLGFSKKKKEIIKRK
jgi:hypothetical protein